MNLASKLTAKRCVEYVVATVLPILVASMLYWVLTEAQYPIALMALLLCSVWSATYGSLGSALVAASVSFLSFNFFFTAPQFTLVMDDLNDWALAITLLIVAALIGLQTEQLRRKLIDDAQARAEIERITHEKDRELLRTALMSSLSHDLKTPLATMIGATSSVRELRDDLTPAEQDELLDSVLSEARRLDRYIRNLLDMTRLGHGDLSLDRQEIALADLLASVAQRVKKAWPGCDLRVRATEASYIVEVHPALVGQALFNLVDNAVKFSGVEKPVFINTRFDEGDVVIDIVDHGPGIPEADRDAAFDFFNTLGRGDHHAAGEGLGLAIAKGMISAHGGSIMIMDPVSISRGTCVRIRLPASASTLPDHDRQESHGPHSDH
ncbi:sensor histidine kinase [Natronospirillum operosum]|nr:ATP-binding protein [Natronospirillum operosum]